MLFLGYLIALMLIKLFVNYNFILKKFRFSTAVILLFVKGMGKATYYIIK